MTEYEIGDLARVSAVFTDGESGDAIDPAVVKLAYKPEGGELTTLTYGVDEEIVKDSTGHYHADLDIVSPGVWRYRWYSTGAGQAAEEGSFSVKFHMVS